MYLSARAFGFFLFGCFIQKFLIFWNDRQCWMQFCVFFRCFSDPNFWSRPCAYRDSFQCVAFYKFWNSFYSFICDETKKKVGIFYLECRRPSAQKKKPILIRHSAYFCGENWKLVLFFFVRKPFAFVLSFWFGSNHKFYRIIFFRILLFVIFSRSIYSPWIYIYLCGWRTFLIEFCDLYENQNLFVTDRRWNMDFLRIFGVGA